MMSMATLTMSSAKKLKKIDELVLLLNQYTSSEWEPAVVRFFSKVKDIDQRLKFMELVEVTKTTLAYGNPNCITDRNDLFELFKKVQASVDAIKEDELDNGRIRQDVWNSRVLEAFRLPNLDRLKLQFEWNLLGYKLNTDCPTLAKYILLSLEQDDEGSFYDRTNGLQLNFADVEVDQVFPATLTKKWVDWKSTEVPDQPGVPNWHPMQRIYRPTLANLALAVTPRGPQAAQLRELQNGSWKRDKLNFYEGTGSTRFFARTSELCQNDTFTFEECKERGEEMLESLAARYELCSERMLAYWRKEGGGYAQPYAHLLHTYGHGEQRIQEPCIRVPPASTRKRKRGGDDDSSVASTQ
mmetsp:Transcript_70048/g.123478  ORF Transcript_70048/g.123478 Transcript_70048/m.123478 type:complete len:355 (-) Transcript_70048:307-1371(-)